MSRKRELKRAYRERQRHLGLVEISCAECGRLWLDLSMTPETYKNGLLFKLQAGLHPNPRMSACFAAHQDALTVVIREQLPFEDSSLSEVQAIIEDELRLRATPGTEILVRLPRF
ncbi:hypothetical protein [Sphingopyxis kveilinensis]|uniref:hypothetical protein n=1 Tax=Sphingopyxis kveilinensis TaxID=3114367 RepID=UPI0030D26199